MKPGVLAERYLKRAFFGALAGRSGGRRALPDPAELDRVRRVLLVRPNFRLGNLVLVTPAIAVLRRRLPGVELDVMCGAPYAELFACDAAVRETIAVPRDLHRRPAEMVRLVRRLRARRYDLVIDGARGSSFLGAFFTWATGGALRVASSTSRYRALFNVHIAPDKRSWHKADVFLDLFRGLGLEVDGASTHVALSEADHRQADVVWRSLGLHAHERVVGVVLGARGAKQLPLAQVVDIVRGLHDAAHARVLAFTAPEDRARLDEIERTFTRSVAIAPPVPVRVFAALLSRCAAAITPDSGPMHLAAAVGTPTVTLVRTEQSTYYLPREAKHRAVHRAGGSSAQAVVAAVQSILAQA
jgi:heptosyltransferase-3